MSPARAARRARFESLEPRQMLSAGSLSETSLGDDAAPRLLFVRGGDRTGGFLEANNDFGRTEQLADINNFSTSGGNHGWGELRQTLEGAGYVVEQITEGSETASGPAAGIAIDFAAMDLTPYDAVVFGSNNAVYTTASVDAVESYIRGGGSALFISDANFGGDWADASDSDQQFLDRFGFVAHQDLGTYAITRGAGEFLVPDHPIFTDVNQFDGEGVTPIRVETPTSGVSATILARAEGSTRLNEPPFGANNLGPSRQSGPNDAVSLIATVDDGRIAGHFDRNTFFNLNGAGTDINRFDNRRYALNLFGWLVGVFDAAPGDYNDDGAVNDLDRAVWAATYGAVGVSPADGNGDGVVDAADFTVWRDNADSGLPGDYNDNGIVNDLDRAVWANVYGAVGPSPADGNGDGVIDAADFTVWRDHAVSTGTAVSAAASTGAPRVAAIDSVHTDAGSTNQAARGGRIDSVLARLGEPTGGDLLLLVASTVVVDDEPSTIDEAYRALSTPDRDTSSGSLQGEVLRSSLTSFD